MLSHGYPVLIIALVVLGACPLPLFAQATTAAGDGTTIPAGSAKHTFVLVHGAFAGGWEWKKCGELLASHGHTVYRPTLTGQGERVHLASTEVDVNTHIQDVVNTILFEDLHDIVLVGHSYGGVVITGVADRVPDRIQCVIYVDAGLPLDGQAAVDAKGGEPPKVEDGYVRLRPATQPAGKPPYIVDMPAKTFFTPVSLKNQAVAQKIPTMYILTVNPGKKPEDDVFFKPYQIAKERGWATSIMIGDHVVHLTQTANLVERLEKATVEAKPADVPR